jgi:hypothetical protein
MGGRQGPTVCEHGRVVDWGDFDHGYGRPECVECEDEKAAETARLRKAVALHQPIRTEHGVICVECRKVWPCSTAHTAGVQ